MPIFFGLLIMIAFVVYIVNTVDDVTNDKPKKTIQIDDVVADAFIAVVKLTPDLHIAEPSLKKRIRNYARTAFETIDSKSGTYRSSSFAQRIDKREQIKVKELEKKVAIKLKDIDFQNKKEILIGMWALAYADGQATLDQQKLISILGKAMGLSYTACNKVETMFWQRMKSGKFGDYKAFEKRRDKWFEDEEVRKAEKEFEKKRRENSNTYDSSQKNTNYANISPELQKAYAVLGIDPSSSIDEIKNQKKKLLKRYHPDLFANQGEEMIRKATIKAQSINQAYEKIMESR